MKRAVFFLFFVFLGLAAWGQDAPRPLTKQRLLDTLDVLKGDAADVLIAQVRQRGVEFQASEEDEQELRAAGASANLIVAIRTSFKQPPLRPVSPGQPLSREDLVLLLENGAPLARVEELVSLRGVNFGATPEAIRELQSAGAGSRVIALVRERAVPDGPPPQPVQQEAATRIEPLPPTPPPTPPAADPPPVSGSVPLSPLPPSQPTPLPQPEQPVEPQGPEPVWVVFYHVCEKPDARPLGGGIQIRFGGVRPEILANDRELVKMDCGKYFYAVVQPGSYKFCATKKKCKFVVVSSGSLYYFRIFSKNEPLIEQLTTETAQAEMQQFGIGPLDSKRFSAPEFVTTDSDRPPPSVMPAMLPPVRR